MATCYRVTQEIEGTFTDAFEDQVQDTFLVQLDSASRFPNLVLSAAQGLAPEPVPARGVAYDGYVTDFLFARRFEVRPVDEEDLRYWHVTVTWLPADSPEGGGSDNSESGIPPWLRAPVYDIEYMEVQRVLDLAYNVEDLPHGFGAAARPPNTLGPILNSVGERPDEPQVWTDQLEVIVIKKNFRFLRDIIQRNRLFRRTTNEDTVEEYTARQLSYLLTHSQGHTVEGDWEYYPGVTRILADKTSDLLLNNMGFDYWNPDLGDSGKVVPILYLEGPDKGERISSPKNLNLDGTLNTGTPTTITYYHADPIPYLPLFQ